MTTVDPIGPSSRNNAFAYPYGSYSPHGWTTTVTSPVSTHEVSVACPDCGMIYGKRASVVADAERDCRVWLNGHRSEQHSDVEPEPEHAAMDDGTVLRDRTAKSLGLSGNGISPSSRGLRRLAAEHLDTAVLQPRKTTLDEADLTAIATLVSGVAQLDS